LLGHCPGPQNGCRIKKAILLKIDLVLQEVDITKIRVILYRKIFRILDELPSQGILYYYVFIHEPLLTGESPRESVVVPTNVPSK